MKKRGLSAFAVFAAVALITGCSGAPVQRTPEFERADTNHDGKVSLAEWLRFGGMEASFLAADFNHEGFLTETEFRQAVRLNDEAAGNGSARQQAVLDSQILADTKTVLAESRAISAWNITVEVYQGNVTLSGPVRTPREKQTAEQIASNVNGVKAVFNQLVIKQ